MIILVSENKVTDFFMILAEPVPLNMHSNIGVNASLFDEISSNGNPSISSPCHFQLYE